MIKSFNIETSKYFNKLEEWYNSNKQALLLYGNIGSGKTYIANEYLKYKNHNIYYYNINEIKNKTKLIDMFKDISKINNILSIFNNEHKLNSIIIDDIDFSHIIKTEFINLFEFKKNNLEYKNKIILITRNNNNILSIKKYLFQIKLFKPNKSELKIVAEQYLNNKTKINYILNNCENDYNKLITLCKNIKNLNILSSKDNFLDIYNYSNELYEKYINIKNTELNTDLYTIIDILYENTYNNIIENHNYKKNNKIINRLTKIYNTFLDISKFTNNNINNIYNDYLLYYGCKNISYQYNKIKKKQSINININYNKDISIHNMKNSFLKLKLNFNMYPIFFKFNNLIFNLFIEYLNSIKNTKKKEIITKKYNLNDITYNLLIKNSLLK